MPLLQWCTLSPQGPSNLAAIRFAAPIRVSSIRVFPKGALPFVEFPDIIASTWPEAFSLEMFFNAQAIQSNADSKEKQRAPNALVPTSIAYAGGQVDFLVDMGTEYATRLMIVKGNFEIISMAIYGDIVSEFPPVQTYEPIAHALPEPFPLSSSIDPANSSDPTLLAQSLLSLIPNSPPLSLVVRLMFCLKPADEDWDHPEFPYLYADLRNKDEDFDLEGLIRSVSRPLRDDTSSESLSVLVNRINDLVGPRDNDQSYYLAKLLSVAASQKPAMARELLDHLDFRSNFDEHTLEEPTLFCLLDACANRDVAKHFGGNEAFLNVLEGLSNSSKSERHTQLAAFRLSSRMNGWKSFEDSLTNTRGDFSASAHVLKDISREENSLGIWVSCVTAHEDLIPKLGENPVLTTSQLSPPLLFNDPLATVSHDEFIAFVRALIGVVAVVAVWSWADSLGNDTCRERILAILSLWQGMEGYKQILNHLLLLRQLNRRLGWIISDSNPPRKSGIFAEHILADLAKEPNAVLQEELMKTLLSLEQPLSHITESDRLAMRKIALVAEDGLPAAAEELVFVSDRPFSLRRLRTLRVSIAIIQRELGNDSAERCVLETFWEEGSHGLIFRLVDILFDVADDLNHHFALKPMLQMNQPLSDQLFRTADDFLGLISHLSTGYPLTSRSLRSLTTTIADLFACSDAADLTFARTSSACMSAQAVRQTCLDTMRLLCAPTMCTETGTSSAQVILSALLQHGTYNSGRDPICHVLQVFSLIDYILPDPNQMEENPGPSDWLTLVIPRVLSDLKSFSRLLDAENRSHLLKRLIVLDSNVIGVGEWLLLEELKFLTQNLKVLSYSLLSDPFPIVLQLQVSDSIAFLLNLFATSSSTSAWYRDLVSSNPDIAQMHTRVLDALLDGYYCSSHLTQFVQCFAKEVRSFDPDLRFSILLHLLRFAQLDPTFPDALDFVLEILQELPPTAANPATLRPEIGLALSAFGEHTATLHAERASTLLSILQWLVMQEDTRFSTLTGLKGEIFSDLCDFLVAYLPESANAVSDVRSLITVDDDEVLAIPPVELPSQHLAFSLHALKNLLHPIEDGPATPRAGNKTPDILGIVISPPTALLRSPAATGLTKTYMNNDFRQLRQIPSARLNTSRLPSMHVDDFEISSPTLLPAPDIVMGS